jgi:hypothetical protein
MSGPFRQAQDRAQLAANLDPQRARLRNQGDRLHQAAHQFPRLGGIPRHQRLAVSARSATCSVGGADMG